MAKIVNQNIPSEYEAFYKEIARAATEMFPGSGNLYAFRRYPFKLPYHPRIGTIDGTPGQHTVRTAFQQCANCFNIQPYSGGETPPAIGPRNRSWWFAAAAGSGLWYFDYFMQQSLNIKLPGGVPDWCQAYLAGAVQIDESRPNTNFHSETYPGIRWFTGSHLEYFVKPLFPDIRTPQNATLYIYLRSSINNEDKQYKTSVLGVYRILEDWSPTTLTWNNRPSSAGPTIQKSFTFDYSLPPVSWVDVEDWIYISIPNATDYPYGMIIKMIAPQINNTHFSIWGVRPYHYSKEPIFKFL